MLKEVAKEVRFCSLARNQSDSVPARTHDYVPCSVLLTARIAYYKDPPFS